MAKLPLSAMPRKLSAAEKALGPSEPKLVAAGSKKLADAITTAYKARTGDGRLSGTKTKRRQTAAPVFAKVKDIRRDKKGNYVALVIPMGAHGLIEQAIEPHRIGPVRATSRGLKGARTRGRRNALKPFGGARGYEVAGMAGAQAAENKYLAGRSKALRLPDGGIRAGVNHPGTTPRRVFHPTAVGTGPLITIAMAEEAGKIIRTAYRAAR